MSLNKSNPPNQYIPFQETSFGFGSGAVAAEHTNLAPTDIVKVRIVFIYGTHWDETTGHISTPSVGTAVSTFNKYNNEWLVRGELADVDAVLAQLKFFPSDYEDTRTWSPTPFKDNQTTGNYGTLRGAGEEQPNLIPDTRMSLTVHDANDNFLSGHTVTWEATGYDYDNNRPYFSVEPTIQDVSSLGIPPLIDLGTIAHVPATDNVTVSCEFRHYNSTSTYTGSAYGSFTNQSRFYVADKKEGTRDNVSNRFNFTGSLVEAQAFLDNIGYNRPSTEQTFDMVLRVSDGVIGSEVTKTCWFSDYPFEPTELISDFIATEEEDYLGLMPLSNTTWSLNYPVEVDEFWYTITLDSTAQDGITYMSDGTIVNGVYTPAATTTSPQLLRDVFLKLLLFQFRDDFNDDFTFDIQFHGRNQTLGTSYSSTPQTVNVTMTDTLEISNLFTSHNFEEDHRYYFANGAGLPNIAHGYNRQYTARVTASDPNAIDIIWTYVPTANYQHGVDFFWENGDQLRMVGTRDEVNEMLNGMYFEPATDYDQNFSFSYKQTRLGGDTTSDAAEGDYYNVEIGVNNCISMTCAVSHDEYSFTAPPSINWIEDTSKSFNTGIQVTDLSDEHENTSSYQTDYTVYMKMVDASGNDYNYGYLNSTSTGGAVGNAGGANPKSYTGSKAQVNQAIANMKYIPDVDITDAFFIQFKIVRDFDGAVLADYDQTRQITFNSAQVDGVYSTISQPNINWDEDTFVDFNSNIIITDLATENPDITNYYQTNYILKVRAKDNDNNALTTATWTSTSYGSATLSGTGTVSDPLTITGSKADINTALENLRMIPDPDWTTSPATDGGFWLEYRIEREYDNVFLINYNESIAFNSGLDTTEYTNSIGTVTYTEDVAEQYIFSGINFIEDLASNIHSNITYESTIKIANVSYGEAVGSLFGNYVEENYIEEAQFQQQTYVVNTEVTFSGTKADVNAALQNVWFTPYRDNNASFDILYTQKRYINGVLDVTHANDVNLGTITATARLEVVLGTANSNIQYFVSDEFTTGVNVGQSRATILSSGINTTLTPRQIISNMISARNYNSSLPSYQFYQPPFTLIDEYDEDGGESKYRFIVTGDNFPTGVSLSTVDSGWLTRTQLASLIYNGITVTGMTEAIVPSHNTQYTVTFKIDRQTFSGIEETIYNSNNTLTYQFLTGIKVYKQSIEKQGTLSFTVTETRIDNLTSSDSPVYFDDTIQENYPDTSYDVMRDKIKIKTQDSVPFVNHSTPEYDIPDGVIDYGTGYSLAVYGLSYTGGNSQQLNYYYEWDEVMAANLSYLINTNWVRRKNTLGFRYAHSTTLTDRSIHIFCWTPWGAAIRFGQYNTGGINQISYYPSDVSLYVTR